MTEPVYDFDAWLDGASLTQKSVEILQNPALLSRWDDLQRRYEHAQQVGQAEVGIEDVSPLAALEAEADELLAEIEASRSVWHVRALTDEDVAAIMAAHPITPAPQFGGQVPSVQPNPTEAQAKAFLGAYTAYGAKLEAWKAEHAAELEAHEKATADALLARGAEKVARAVVRVEQGGATVTDRVSVEQVIALERRIGKAQISKIIAAIDAATTDEPEVPAGFLSRRSGADQT